MYSKRQSRDLASHPCHKTTPDVPSVGVCCPTGHTPSKSSWPYVAGTAQQPSCERGGRQIGPQNQLWAWQPRSFNSALHPLQKLLCLFKWGLLTKPSVAGQSGFLGQPILLKLTLPHHAFEKRKVWNPLIAKINVNYSKNLDNQTSVLTKKQQ